MTQPALLTVSDLRTYFYTGAGVARAVDGVSFTIGAGETLGIVGESGCGKSVTALSILRLVQQPGRIEPGSRIMFEGQDLLQLDDAGIRRVRGNRIAMIFQNPILLRPRNRRLIGSAFADSDLDHSSEHSLSAVIGSQEVMATGYF